jgi:hypothetical protein
MGFLAYITTSKVKNMQTLKSDINGNFWYYRQKSGKMECQFIQKKCYVCVHTNKTNAIGKKLI